MGINRRIVFCGAAMIAASLLSGTFAEVASGGYDYSHRKSKCKVTVTPNATVRAKLVRNHFAFGASINKWSFDTLQKGVAGVTQNYGDVFIKYFDFATPENEMKWAYVQGDTVMGPPNWKKADFLMEFCQKNNILVRGHNLFWNEKKDWIPKWTWGMDKTAFKAAMRERIDSAMTKFNGQVVQWDIINEIVHAVNGTTPSTTMLDSMTGDPNIFAWILDEARKIDKTAKFVINDYNLSTGEASQLYINKCKPLAAKFDLIGDEGHFGTGVFTKATIDSKVKTLVDGLGGKKLCFTEVDWQFDSTQSPAKMEEILRTCFANKNIEGMILWVWTKRRMWRPMTSVIVDSLLVETPAGKKYREVRAEWKTDTTGTADANGLFSFTGYQGRYQIISGSDTQCVYLYPGDSTAVLSDQKKCNCPDVAELPVMGIGRNPQPAHGITLRGKTLLGDLAALCGQKLSLVTYSLSGKQLSEIAITPTTSAAIVPAVPAGCHVYRVCSAGRTLFTGVNLNIR
jgi:GH35 family endo-1,4-beta-xylanase